MGGGGGGDYFFYFLSLVLGGIVETKKSLPIKLHYVLFSCVIFILFLHERIK